MKRPGIDRDSAIVDVVAAVEGYVGPDGRRPDLDSGELEQLTPDERHRVINEGIVTDLDQLSPEFLARVRTRGRALLEARGLIAPDRDGG